MFEDETCFEQVLFLLLLCKTLWVDLFPCVQSSN
jgi:hypothetical protein